MPGKKPRWSPPATMPDIREKQLIVLATDLAEQQLREGTASAAVITHYLKLAGEKNNLEMEKLKQERELLKAKVDSLESGKQTEALYQEAIKAMQTYSGVAEQIDDNDDY